MRTGSCFSGFMHMVPFLWEYGPCGHGHPLLGIESRCMKNRPNPLSIGFPLWTKGLAFGHVVFKSKIFIETA